MKSPIRCRALRRLLIAAAVLLAGPAQAVDYVQCQAIQRTIWQLEDAQARAKNLASVGSRNKLMKRDCGDIPKAEYVDPSRYFYKLTPESERARDIYHECAKQSEAANRTVIKIAELIDPDVIIIGNKLQRVRRDFSRSCY